jgi:hypothetical protein
MTFPPRFILFIFLVVVVAGLGLQVDINGQNLVGLIGLAAGMAGFIALHIVGYAIERRKPNTGSKLSVDVSSTDLRQSTCIRSVPSVRDGHLDWPGVVNTKAV